MDPILAIRNISETDVDPTSGRTFFSLARENAEKGFPLYLMTCHEGQIFDVNYYLERRANISDIYAIDLISFKNSFKNSILLIANEVEKLGKELLAVSFNPRRTCENFTEHLKQGEIYSEILMNICFLKLHPNVCDEQKDYLTGLETRINATLIRLTSQMNLFLNTNATNNNVWTKETITDNQIRAHNAISAACSPEKETSYKRVLEDSTGIARVRRKLEFGEDGDA